MNPNKILAVAKREYLSNMKRKAFLLMMILFPLFLLFVGAIQTFGASKLETNDQKIAVVDESGGNISIEGKYPTKESALTDLVDKKIDILYIIDPSFYENGSITTYTRKGELTQVIDSSAFQQKLLKALLMNVDEKTAKRIIEPPVISARQVDENLVIDEPNFIQIGLSIGIGFVLILCTFMNSSLLLQSVVEEKENRVIEVILSSISSFELLCGKVVGAAALLFTQILLYAIVGLILIYGSGQMGILSSLSFSYLVIILLYFLGGFLLTGAVLVGIGAMATKSREGQQISSIVMIPSIFPLWFLTFIIVEPNGFVATVLSLFPLSSPLGMIIRAGLTTVSAFDIILSLILLYGSAVLAIWVSSKIFRAGTLLSGKRPDAGEIIKMLKEA